MLSPLLKAFGMSKAPEEITLGATRQINLSGNIFSFAMPENFSRDMPAEPLIESLDLNSLLSYIQWLKPNCKNVKIWPDRKTQALTDLALSLADE